MTESRSRSMPDPKCMHCWVSLERKLPYWKAAEKRYEFPIRSKKALATDNLRFLIRGVELSGQDFDRLKSYLVLKYWCKQISRAQNHSRPRAIELQTFGVFVLFKLL